MKLKISESKIRQAVNEELLKRNLNKSIKEQKWPTYTAYLGAEILKLEWQQKLQENNNLDQQPSPEWIAETASAFGLSEAEIAEATEIMNNEELDEGVGGFLKAIAKPYQNIWQTFTNITQHAANLTDPNAPAAQVGDDIEQATGQLPSAEELPQQMAQAAQESPQELGAMIRELIKLLRAADSKVDLDDAKPGLEQAVDQAQGELEDAAGDLMGAVGGEEGAEGGGEGGEAFVFKGKGGKGLQSFLARGSKEAPRLKGKAMGAVLKHISKQLKSQGVTVHEGILDEVQGWMWYGLVENLMQEYYGQPILISEILDGLDEGGRGNRRKRKKTPAQQKRRQKKAQKRKANKAAQGVSGAETSRRQAQSDNDMGRLAQSDLAKQGMMDRAKGGAEPEAAPVEEPAVEEPAAEEAPAAEVPEGMDPDDANCAPGTPGTNNFGEGTGKPCDEIRAEFYGADEEPAAAEAPIEEVPPTVKNTAPEGAPLVKVFKGKGGEGLQSALAKNRDALGIDQQTVSVIIKSVEQWAQANQIKVENVTAETFDSIISEVVPKFRARKLRETINKLKNV